jgi:tetratricopeptide (TPR) repeat protein
MLGVIAHTHGNFSVAERHFERALEINPAYTEAALNLAVTCNDNGKYDKARDVYHRVSLVAKHHTNASRGIDPFARGKIANMHASLGRAYHDAGLTREAIAEYEKATQLCPHFADLHVAVGTLLREVNDLPNARAHYEAALEAKAAYVPARLKLGLTLLALGDASAAEEQWKKVIEVEPDNSQAKMYLRGLERNRSAS